MIDKVYETIVTIVEGFFTENDTAIDMLFAMWFNLLCFFADIQLKNPSYVEILTAFNDFVKEFLEKTE